MAGAVFSKRRAVHALVCDKLVTTANLDCSCGSNSLCHCRNDRRVFVHHATKATAAMYEHQFQDDAPACCNRGHAR
uniref:Uncharacterized protein n=1 Tax=Oryza meridionalis TaxID=40149 RepID=A0A0E0ESC5_9ORYZ